MWGLLNLELWYRTFIDGDGVQTLSAPLGGSDPGRARSPRAGCPRHRPMRILWLSTNLLLPLDKGGKLRTWHLMRHLAQRHSITYVSFADPGHAAEDRRGMSEVCSELVTIPRREQPKEGLRFYAGGGASSRSIPCPTRSRSTDRGLIAARCAQRSRARSTTASSAISSCPPSICRAACRRRRVLFTHNVEAEIWRRHAETETELAAQATLPAAVDADAALRRPDDGPVRSRARRVGCRSRHAAAALSAGASRRQCR